MAWGLNGTTEYARLLDFDGYSLGSMPDGPWAVGLLFRRNSDELTPKGLISAGISTYDVVFAGTDGGMFGLLQDTGGATAQPNKPYVGENGVWHSVVIGRNAAGAGFVTFDDAIGTQGTLTEAFGNMPAWILGAKLDDFAQPPGITTGTYFNGDIAEFWRVDREVTAQDLADLAAFTPAEEVFGEDLVWLFKMDTDPVDDEGSVVGSWPSLEPVGSPTFVTHPVTRGGGGGDGMALQDLVDAGEAGIAAILLHDQCNSGVITKLSALNATLGAVDVEEDDFATVKAATLATLLDIEVTSQLNSGTITDFHALTATLTAIEEE